MVNLFRVLPILNVKNNTKKFKDDTHKTSNPIRNTHITFEQVLENVKKSI